MTMEKSEPSQGDDGAAGSGGEVDRNHFPTRLHLMLQSLTDSDHGSVVSWQPHGRVFMIRDTDVFVDQVLPKYV